MLTPDSLALPPHPGWMGEARAQLPSAARSSQTRGELPSRRGEWLPGAKGGEESLQELSLKGEINKTGLCSGSSSLPA